MTEDELKAIEAEALGTALPDPDIERAWIERQLKGSMLVIDGQPIKDDGLESQEQQLMAHFRMCKFLRDDARMRQAADNLRRVREALLYLRRRLEDL